MESARSPHGVRTESTGSRHEVDLVAAGAVRQIRSCRSERRRYRIRPTSIVADDVDADGAGHALVTSTGPDGNIGFPATDEENAHFRVTLEKVVKRMTRDDIDMLLKSLVEFRGVTLETR